jgi:hypothetical protein
MSAVAFVATADGLILNPQTLQGNAVIGCLEVSLMYGAQYKMWHE